MEKRKLLMLDAAHRAMSTIEPPRPGARCTRAALGAGRPRYGGVGAGDLPGSHVGLGA